MAVAAGAGLRCRRVPAAFKTGLFFGGFQALMPVLGWLAAWRFRGALDAVDHWVAFALLAAIGGKMIWESRRLAEPRRPACVEDTRVLFLLGVATSLDALAVGISFSFLGVAVLTPAAVIGLVAFALSFAGILLGSRLGHFCENRLEAAGGAVLILIGLKVLYSGLTG
ncbi:MAG TPA: manganese efflux pump MntP family protein [bacterium]|nr:manganese efflux pump MntP family protein [bacterium]